MIWKYHAHTYIMILANNRSSYVVTSFSVAVAVDKKTKVLSTENLVFLSAVIHELDDYSRLPSFLPS